MDHLKKSNRSVMAAVDLHDLSTVICVHVWYCRDVSYISVDLRDPFIVICVHLFCSRDMPRIVWILMILLL